MEKEMEVKEMGEMSILELSALLKKQCEEARQTIEDNKNFIEETNKWIGRQ
jgi:hypothetical protein